MVAGVWLMGGGLIWVGSLATAWGMALAIGPHPDEYPAVGPGFVLLLVGCGVAAAALPARRRARPVTRRQVEREGRVAPPRRRSYWPSLVLLSPCAPAAIVFSVQWGSARYFSRFGVVSQSLVPDPLAVLLTPGTLGLAVSVLLVTAVVARRGGLAAVALTLAATLVLACGLLAQYSVRLSDRVRRGEAVETSGSLLPFRLYAQPSRVVPVDGSPSPVSARAVYLGLAGGDYVLWDPDRQELVRIPLDSAAVFVHDA
jgi:hypothetical protein